MKNIERINELTTEFTAIRRDFHRHPELSHHEWKTAEKIADFLKLWGYEVHCGIGGAGVVGIIRNGTSSKCISIRADMDALPVTEANLFAHASTTPGVMHACGHDGHMAMALLTARYLAETKRFDGKVQFVFQPSEEQDGGASDMVNDGLFERFPTDCIIACHNWPDIPEGKIGINYQTIMASCNAFKITVKGRGSHGAMPNESIDPVFVAVQIVNCLQAIITRQKNPLDAAVLSICKLCAGKTYNVIPDSAEIEGTVRTFSEAVTTLIAENMEKIAHQVALAFGAQCEVHFVRQVPPVSNRSEIVSAIENAAIELFGSTSVVSQAPVMPSEDFGVYLKHRPGALFFIGNGEGSHRVAGHGEGPCSLHNPSYDFNDAILPIGAGLFVTVVENYLSNTKN